MNIQQARALIAEHLDYGQSLNVDGLAVAIANKSKEAPALAALQYALSPTTVEGMPFLEAWFEGDFEACRAEWPDAPESCYPDAEAEGHVTVDEAVSACQALTQALQEDQNYAWAWHCNLAMPIMDTLHCTPEQANEAGATLMRHIFDIDVKTFKEWELRHAQDPSTSVSTVGWIDIQVKQPEDNQLVAVLDPEHPELKVWPAVWDASTQCFTAGRYPSAGWFEKDEIKFWVPIPIQGLMLPQEMPDVLANSPEYEAGEFSRRSYEAMLAVLTRFNRQ